MKQQLIHGINIMDESLKNFDQFRKAMSNEVNVTKAEKEVAERIKELYGEEIRGSDK